ncbi:MAG TPA: hypothetical protein DDZ99_01300 [Clostridiales bacterium]|nr:hypothetical protein [Clostridiales bacterium]
MAVIRNLYAGRLSDEDAELFYKLWMGLLDFVNAKCDIDSSLGRLTSPKGQDIQKLLPLRTKIWEDVGIIDAYISAEKSLNKDEISILAGWKKAINLDFIVVKHLKNHSVLMTNEKMPLLYGTIGIYSTCDEMIPKERLPVAVNCMLLPFKGKIINDSFLLGGNITFDSGYRKGLNDAYQNSKERYGIINSLDDNDELIAKHAADSARMKCIENEILVDTYNEDEEMSAWHCYLTDTLTFPFGADASKQMLRSPLLSGEKVTVTGLAGMDDCYDGLVVMIQWQGRIFAVLLEQLSLDGDTSEKTREAVEDWQYWISSHGLLY